jgi:hypothetical protein
MELRILTIHIVDAAGAPVENASLVIKREATGEVVARRSPPQSGSEYGLFDDSSLPTTAPDGDWFVIDITAGSKKASVRQRLGRTQPCSCHIERKSGDQRVVIS